MGNGVSTYNGGVNCHNQKAASRSRSFRRLDGLPALLVRQGQIRHDSRRRPDEQPGPLPDAASADQRRDGDTGSPYFTENAGDQAQMHDGTITLDYMPAQFITFRLEESYRYSNVPYWTGRGGITPYAPGKGDIHQNVGNPSDYICSGSSSGWT
jgi:hypothetical protein